ncbi:MAG: L-2-amino-thiazoline-4-carboxylic acid hydrolase [Candidatus Bathyarchaeia archaeon]
MNNSGDEYLEDLFRSTIEMWGAMVGMIIKGVVERFGEDGKKIVRDAVFKACKWQTEKTLNEMGVRDRGTKALAELCYPEKGSKFGDVGVFDIEHLRVNDKSFIMKVKHCPYVKTWKALGIIEAVPDLCDLLTEGDNGVSSVFNPRLRMTLKKCMTKGDPYCIYSWEEV